MRREAKGKKMNQNGNYILYHRTTDEVARSIIEHGFRNDSGYFMGQRTWTGVWLTARVPDAKSGAGETILRVSVSMPERELSRWEWTGEGRGCREWLIPAGLLNRKMRVELLERRELTEVAA